MSAGIRDVVHLRTVRGSFLQFVFEDGRKLPVPVSDEVARRFLAMWEEQPSVQDIWDEDTPVTGVRLKEE